MADIIYVERILKGKVKTISVNGIAKISDKLIASLPTTKIRGVVDLG